MVGMTTYTVAVTREDDWCLAEVAGIDGGSGTHERSRAALDESVRDLVVLAEDLPDETAPSLELHYRYDVNDKVLQIATEVARTRAQVNRDAERIRADTERLVSELRDKGYSVRDTASVLGITPGRVSQLEHERVA